MQVQLSYYCLHVFYICPSFYIELNLNKFYKNLKLKKKQMWLSGKASDYRSEVHTFDSHLKHFGIIYNGDFRSNRSWTIYRTLKHWRAGGKLRYHRKCSIKRMLTCWKKPLLSEISNNVNGLPTETFDFIEYLHCLWCIGPNINVTDIGHLFC